ncbi:unnamed protein product [Candida verbasci]|uniref:Uncharacterized protein n=1 Tax=Candida verbasci TaxID=1227364 RepID=A0A9W4TV87_9ASCO|nr:unnamed protein product [Candida verbasci]
MPDLFDNFFNKITTKFSGGHTTHYYGGSSQVNTGKFYNYHSTPNNNNYWLPTKKKEEETKDVKDRDELLNRSRFNSVATSESDQSTST